MKLFHISDLHIGKMLHSYNLEEEQRDVFDQIAKRAEEYRPDAILIAGDIYDKSIPAGRAFKIFDGFLNALADIKPSIPVFMISGNHDSPARLQFASSFLKKHNIYISVMPPQKEEEHLEKITLNDEFGPVHFYLLPFTKPGYVRQLFDEELTYEQAVAKLIEREEIDYSERNVIVAHQFFIAGSNKPEKGGSEILSIVGIDSVDVSCIKQFDYAALGHIHRQQRVGADHIRYSGTPLKYSVSEEHDKKGILFVTIGEKGTPNTYEQIPLTPLRNVRTIRGEVEDIIENADKNDDYVSITVTDEETKRTKERLSEHFPRILEVKVDNTQTRTLLRDEEVDDGDLDPFTAFCDFFKEMNGREMNERETKVIRNVFSSDDAREEE